MSDHPDLSEPVPDLSEATSSTTVWPVRLDGQTYCRTCHEMGHRVPNHPRHPRSPYCEFHFRQARNGARQQHRIHQRERAKALEGARQARKPVYVAEDGYTVLDPEAAERLWAAIATWEESVGEVADALNFGGSRMIESITKDLEDLAASLAHWLTALKPERTD